MKNYKNSINIEKKDKIPFLKRKSTIHLFFAIISGVLIFLSFPETSAFYTVFIALIPLFIITENEKSYKKVFLYGFIMQMVTIFGGFYWLIQTIALHGHLPVLASIPVFILYAAFFGLRFPLFMLLSKFLINRTGFSRFLIYPFVFTFVEFIFPDLFPWFIANSQHNNKFFIQIADITGVYGISIALVLINTLIYHIYLMRKNLKNISRLGAGITVLVVVLFYTYGIIRYNHIKELENKANPIRIGTIQPCTPLLTRERLREKQNSIKKVFALSEQILKNNQIDILIWPESSSDVLFRAKREEELFNTPLINMVKANSIYLLFSDIELIYEATDNNGNIVEIDPFNRENLIQLRRFRNPQRRIYSTAVLLNKDGILAGNYRKVYPLPFAEYMPLGETFPFLKKMFAEIGSFSAGKEINVLTTSKGIFAPSICYELIIPSFTRKFIEKGATFILNQTNDGWFGNTKASAQHLTLSLFRAIENRVPIVRSTNSGISTIISATGDFITRMTGLYETTTLVGEIRPTKAFSFYTRFSNLFGWLVTLVFMLGFSLAFRKKILDRINKIKEKATEK